MGLATLLGLSCGSSSKSSKSVGDSGQDSTLQVPFNFYDLEIMALDSQETIKMSDFKGKKLLLVNVASKCGYTYQYKELQELHEKYGDKVQVIGFPCNQFLFQEPGSSEQIQNFCSANYGVTFPLSTKISVKGSNQHPVYSWLTLKKYNGVEDYTVSWNFNKFLISEDGKLMAHFGSKVEPMSTDILNAIGAQ